MTTEERATLRDLFKAMGELRQDMTSRFDGQDERLRSVENKVIAMQAVESERKDAKVGIHWTWTTVLSILGLSATTALGVIGIVLRVLGI